MNKFITLLFIIIRDDLAGFDRLLNRDTAVAPTHGVGSAGVSTSIKEQIN